MNSADTKHPSASEIAAQVAEVLVEEPGLRMVILYGSAAAGTMRADSDVDVAVLFDHPLGAKQKMELISRVRDELKRDADLVDLYDLNGTILKQILRKGRVLVEKEPGILAGLAQRMMDNQTDMMPYVSRTLLERQRRFVHG